MAGRIGLWSRSCGLSARLAEAKAIALADEAELLARWLRNDILSVAGPEYAIRRDLFNFVVAELRVREPACPHRIRPVRTLLEKQRDNLLAFAVELDRDLAALAQEWQISVTTAREVLQVQSLPTWDPKRWRREASLLPEPPPVPPQGGQRFWKSYFGPPPYRMLGVVPLLSLGQQGHVKIALFSHAKPRSGLAETYKSIRTRIELLRRNWEGKVFMVTSPQTADGKSTIASNLAICMAQSGRKVLLIDADLRRPSQHTLHGLPRSPGLTEVLNDQMPFHQAVQQTEIDNLDFLAAGAEVSYPAELLATDRLGTLLRELRQAYDLVLLDTSPLLVVTDPSVIAVVIDGILLIVRAAVTRRLDAERSQDLLKALETPVLGLVINGINPGQVGYGYLYGYGAYGRASSSGNGDDPAPGLLSDLASAPAKVPRIEHNAMYGHSTADSANGHSTADS